MYPTDALTDVLESIRMTGSIFSRASLAAPWGVESGEMPAGVFHAVVRGRVWATLAAEGEPVALERGDVILFPRGDNHLLTDSIGRPARPIAEMTTVDERGMGRLTVEGPGARTSLICGTVRFAPAGAHPLFSMLPPRDLCSRLRRHDGAHRRLAHRDDRVGDR